MPKPKHLPPKFRENALLTLAGLLAHAPLVYQLPLWAEGSNPTYVRPDLMERSPFPLFFHMAALHPIFWIALTAIMFVRICRNYGWRLPRWRA